MLRAINIRIYPRGAAGGTFYAVVDDGTQCSRPFSLGTKDREEAEAWREQKLDEMRRIAKGEMLRPKRGPIGFDDAWAEYIALPEVKQKSQRTIKHERTCWRLFSEWCRDNRVLTLEHVTTAILKEYRRYLQSREKQHSKAHLDARSVNGYIQHAGVVFTYLVDAELLEMANPFRNIKPLKQERKAAKSRQWDEIVNVVQFSRQRGRDIHLVLVLGLYLGIRRSEILRARWEHIDWKQQRMTIHKTKPRTMTYSVNLYPEIIEALLPYRQPAGYIVRPDITVWPENVRYRWEYRKVMAAMFKALNAGRAADDKIEPFTTHQLRHTLITHLRVLGWPLPDVAAFVCQDEISITAKYGEAGPEMRRQELRVTLREQVG